MAVPVRTGGGAVFEHGEAVPLFGGVPGSGNTNRFTYQPSADGQRFLITESLAGGRPPFTVVLNWAAGLEK